MICSYSIRPAESLYCSHKTLVHSCSTVVVAGMEEGDHLGVAVNAAVDHDLPGNEFVVPVDVPERIYPGYSVDSSNQRSRAYTN